MCHSCLQVASSHSPRENVNCTCPDCVSYTCRATVSYTCSDDIEFFIGLDFGFLLANIYILDVVVVVANDTIAYYVDALLVAAFAIVVANDISIV